MASEKQKTSAVKKSAVKVAGKSKKSIRLAPVSSEADTAQASQAAQIAAPSRAKKRTEKKTWYRSGFDYPMFIIVIVLMAFGIIMMFSASYANAYSTTGDSLYYFKRQAIFAAIGIAAMLFLSVLDYHIFESKIIVIAITVVSLILMVLVKIMGTTQGGAERWLELGGITFQPSEILKFAVIILFAYFTEKRSDRIGDFWAGFVPFALILGIACLILMVQPHLSATVIVFAIGIAMMFVAGIRPKHMLLLIAGVAALITIALLVLNSMGIDYFSDRILSFTDPEADTSDTTFQTYQSLVTIGSGGVFGLGLGNSRQKYSYLPLSRNDFIFSIVCEELGFVGAFLVILLFVILVCRGFYISIRARDKFGTAMAFGITFQIGLQALLNIAVVTNSIPNTGISLPFFSYGGSALLMQLAEMGILLSISRKAALD